MGQTMVRALAGVDLELEPNSFTVLMGPSGSGKSTLLYLLGGLDRATRGHIEVNGQVLDELDENALAVYRRQTVGFIFQSFNLICQHDRTSKRGISYAFQPLYKSNSDAQIN